MAEKKILFINQEIDPYVPDSEMARLGRKIPQAMQEKGYEIRTFMPKWGIINERRGQLHEVIRLSRMMLIIDDTDHPLIIKVASIPSTRIQVYFIDNEDYFTKRQMAFDAEGKEYQDNGERAIFFARGVLETVKKLRWSPDIIHCQGWMCSLIPLYIKTVYQDEPAFSDAKIVTSIFSEQLSSSLGDNFKKSIEFKDVKSSLLDAYGKDFGFLELEKISLDYSDGIAIAGENVNNILIDYAKEKDVPLLLSQDEENLFEVYHDLYNKVLEGKK